MPMVLSWPLFFNRGPLRQIVAEPQGAGYYKLFKDEKNKQLADSKPMTIPSRLASAGAGWPKWRFFIGFNMQFMN
jgi:hypothetical protein